MIEAADDTEDATTTRARRWLLMSAGFASFERFVVGPMLVALASAFQTSISSAATVATAYFVAYGVSQPVWGVISDRYGRVRVVRIALVVAVIGSVLSALAPSILALSAARAVAGAAFGAVVPATITYIGDTLAIKRRQSALSDLLAVMAVGSALATAIAGVVAHYATWRVVFGAIALLCVVILLRLSNVQEPQTNVVNNVVSPLKRMGMVLSSRWALLVMFFGLAEGALVIGTFSLLPAAIEQQGTSAANAGLLAGIYGLSVLVATRLVKRIAANPLVPMAMGGMSLTIGQAVPATFGGVGPMVVTAVLLGIAWAGFHSSLQAWTTTLVPKARAMTIALMTSVLFVGSGLGTAVGGQLLSAGEAQTMFTIAAVASALLAVMAVVARSVYVAPADMAAETLGKNQSGGGVPSAAGNDGAGE